MNETWNGFSLKRSVFEGHDAIVVLPEEGTANGLLAVKTEYWGAFPEAAEIGLLKCGFHLCFIKNDNRFALDPEMDRKARFIRHVQTEYGLRPKCVLVGMSCGGLIAVKFAARYPELISCMYLDAPVVNYMSWPCGFGKGNSRAESSEILSALGFETVSQLLGYREMPLDKLPVLVENRIPIVMVSGDSDTAVPFCENGCYIEKAYKDAGLPIEVYIKPGGDHHPHGLPSSGPVLDFILKHCEG